VQLQDLRGTRFILREQGSGTRLATDAHFRKQRYAPELRMELGSNEAVREAVAGGLGLAVISVHALAPRPATQGVAVLDVAGFPIASQWHIVYPKGKRLTPIAEVFRQQLLVQAGQLLPQGWSSR
jgi:DNA-binding transcriptional LysR family regulator